MNAKTIIKQIELPVSAYYFGTAHYTFWIRDWKDVYEKFKIQMKNTFLDISLYHSTNDIPVILIGTSHDVFVYKQQDDLDFPVKVKQSITIYKPLKYYKRVSFYHVKQWKNVT